MKVVILLGGENKRFLERDYQTHKALLKIDNEKTVLDHIVENELKMFHNEIDKITDVKFIITNYNRVCYNNHKYYEYDDIKKLQIQKLYDKIHSFKTFFDSEARNNPGFFHFSALIPASNPRLTQSKEK